MRDIITPPRVDARLAPARSVSHHRPCPSLALTLLLGWAPCALACAIGALTVMSDQPGLMRYDALLFVFYSLAALPITALLRTMWRSGASLRTFSRRRNPSEMEHRYPRHWRLLGTVLRWRPASISHLRLSH